MRPRVAVLRRPPFRHHGRKVIASLCGYECLALIPRSPLPTISEMVDRRPVIGVALVALLLHHWFWEQDETVVVVNPALARATGRRDAFVVQP